MIYSNILVLQKKCKQNISLPQSFYLSLDQLCYLQVVCILNNLILYSWIGE